MGCNCKKNADKLSKYSDDKGTVLVPLSGFRKVFQFCVRAVVITFVVFALTLCTPIFLVYIFIKFLFGSQVKINIKKIVGLVNGKRN